MPCHAHSTHHAWVHDFLLGALSYGRLASAILTGSDCDYFAKKITHLRICGARQDGLEHMMDLARAGEEPVQSAKVNC